MSSTDKNRLFYTAPAITELVTEGATLQDFESLHYTFALTVTKPDPVTGAPTELACSVGHHCYVVYHWHYTPRINYNVP